MQFKKIYIEITNICNLKCSFCSKSNRRLNEMTVENFEIVLDKIKDYTDYIYLHVKGEPLTHSNLDKILSLTEKYNKKVCITTNGVLLKNKLDILKKYKNIYQINISLHSENNKQNYIEEILEVVDKLDISYISYRFWTLDEGIMDDKTKEYLNKIKEKYNKDELKNGTKLKNKIYLSLEDKFVWPNINNSYYNEVGICYGGKTHIAILNDGTVGVCCLDGEGISNLGNIFISSLEEILESDKYKNIIKGFNDRKVYLEICKHCSYKDRFTKNIQKEEK